MPHWGLSLKNQTFVTTAAPFGIVNVISYKLLLLALLMLFHTQVRVSSGKSHCLQYCLGEGGRLSLWLQQVENTKKIKDGSRYCVFFFFFKSNTALLPCVVYTVQHASTGTTRTAWEEWESAALGALEANSWSRTSGTGFSLFFIIWQKEIQHHSSAKGLWCLPVHWDAEIWQLSWTTLLRIILWAGLW